MLFYYQDKLIEFELCKPLACKVTVSRPLGLTAKLVPKIIIFLLTLFP